METPFFRIRNQSLHIFEGAGDVRLTVPFENRDIYQEIPVLDAAADRQLFTSAIDSKALFLLGIEKGDVI